MQTGKSAGFAVVMTLFFLASAMRIHAQASAGIVGTVTDESGSVIPNANIEIVQNDTAISHRVVTTGSGTYAVSGLLPGRYTVTAEASGFKKTIKDQVLIEIGTQATIDLLLKPGSTSESVQVTAESVALNTTQPQIGTTIEPELINVLPNEISGRGRQIDQFQFLAPGVQGGSFTHEVSGGVWFQQEVVVNGVPMPQAETEGFTTYVNPPWELIHEFRVETSTFSAQYGLGQGAVNYQTSSGTNKFHGNAFEINRNSSFDSKGFFNSQVPTNHENNYGFTAGGPVWLPKLYKGTDRTFFLFTWEKFKQNATVTGGNDTVPTEQERTGDFTDFVDGTTGALIPIYDPTTGQQFAYNGVPNVMDPSRISTNSKALLQYLPEPDRTGLNVGGLDQNRNYNPYANPTLNTNWGYTIDHALTQTQNLHWTEWRNKLTTNQVFVTGPLVAPPNPLNAVATELQLGTGFILNYSNVLTPHLVMTAGAGWMGEINNETPTTKVSLPSVQNGVVLPQISFDGQHAPTQWGTYGSLQDSINRKLAVTLVNNWLWTKGRNTFNMGWEWRRLFQDAFQAGSGGGHFSFSHDTTSTPPLTDGSNGPTFATAGSSFASFLLGMPDSVSRSFSEAVKLRNMDFSPYIQDDIKLNRRLTVNLGLRWDIMVPFTAVDNNIAFLNPTAANTHVDGLPGVATTLGTCSNCVGWNRADIHWNHVGPRFGFAYMINDKTVLQSGFSFAFLNGGAYQFGDTLVADVYTALLAGTYNLSSSGTNVSNFGSWDTNLMPAPAASAIGPTSGIANTIYELGRNDGFAPYTEQWNVNIQRQLPADMFLTLAYVGNREVHILSNLNHPNQYPESALQLGAKLNDRFDNGTAQADGFTLPYANFVADFGSNATVYQALKPFPQYSGVQNQFEGSGTVFYNGLQAKVEKRYTNGLAFLYSLTLARTMSNQDGGNSGFAASAMDKYRQSQEYGVASSDQKYNTKLSGTYELPIGHGKRWLNNKGVVTSVVGGWQIGGILDYEGGSPYSVSQPGYAFQPNGFNRPNRVPSVGLSTNSYSLVKNHFLNPSTLAPLMFNPAAFADTGSDYVLGDAKREYAELRGNPIRNENLTARKNFMIGERVKVTLQVDFYNAFNRALLGSNPDTNVRDTSFGRVTGGSQTNSNRQGQGTLRFEF